MMVEDITLVKSIGKGSFGEVYLTTKAGHKELFATKKVPKSLALQAKVQKYFNNEIYILKNISHPNIIKLYEIKQTLNNYYLVFDLCNGGGLSNCLENYKQQYNRPFPEEVVQYLMRQIVTGLQYLHNKHILHRDLKLDNILVNFEDEEDKINLNLTKALVKIIDFGFARYLDNDSLAQSILGSPINMDPQILEKMKKIDNNQSFGYDQKADIWSLGTICYELLIGAPPFDALTYEELLRKIAEGNYKIPNNLNLSIESISFINAMLQFDPKKRLDINELARHQFLVKNSKNFESIELTKSILSKNPNDFMMNTKDNKKGIWFMFETKKTRLDDVNMFLIDKSKKKEKEKNSGLGPQQEYIINEQQQANIENEEFEEVNNNKFQEEQRSSMKSQELNQKTLDFLNSTFEEINKEFIYVEPMLIPIIPKSDPKVVELEI